MIVLFFNERLLEILSQLVSVSVMSPHISGKGKVLLSPKSYMNLAGTIQAHVGVLTARHKLFQQINHLCHLETYTFVKNRLKN